MSNLKDSLLNRFKLTHVKQVVDGAEVYVKQLSASEAEAYQLSRMDPKTGEVDFSKFKGARADLVAMCLCEEDGSMMFKDGKEAGDTLPTSFIDKAYRVCAKINAMAGNEEAGKD